MNRKIFDGNYFTNESFDETGFSAPDEFEPSYNSYDEEDEEDEDYYEEEEDDEPYYGGSSEYEEDEDEYDEEYESYVYSDGSLYEAKIRLTGKEKKMRDNMSQLMSSLNKEPDYVSAKDKFVKVYKALAKKKIMELGLKVKLANIDKITIRDLS